MVPTLTLINIKYFDVETTGSRFFTATLTGGPAKWRSCQFVAYGNRKESKLPTLWLLSGNAAPGGIPTQVTIEESEAKDLMGVPAPSLGQSLYAPQSILCTDPRKNVPPDWYVD